MSKKKKQKGKQNKWTRAKKAWAGAKKVGGAAKKVGGAVKKEALDLAIEPIGTIYRHATKDIPNAVNAGANVAEKAGSKGIDAVEEFALTRFWAETKGDKANGKLFEFVLDNQSLSGRSKSRLKKAIQNGAKVVFLSSKDADAAKKDIEALGVALGIEGLTNNDPRYFLACDNGATILSSVSGDFKDAKGIDLMTIENQNNGLARFDADDLPVVKTTTTPAAWRSGAGIIENLESFKSKNSNIDYKPEAKTITIKVTDNRALPDVLGLANNIIKTLSLSPSELSKYGIGLTLDGNIQIRPLDQTSVNAEFTVRKMAGIKGQNVRRSVSCAAQVSQNMPLDTFMSRFVKNRTTGEVYTTEEAKQSGLLHNLAASMFVPQIDMLVSNSATNDGSWLARTTLKNRKDMQLLSDMYADYVYMVARRSTGVQTAASDIGLVVTNAMMTMYDMPVLAKNKNVISYSKFLKAQETGDTSTINAFQSQANDYCGPTASNVVQYLMSVPAEYKVYPTHKGFVGRFFYGISGKSRMPDEVDKQATKKAGKESDVVKVKRLDTYLNQQASVVQELVAYSTEMTKLENTKLRAQEGNDFTEFLEKVQRDIQNGATQEQVFEKVTEYINSRDLQAKATVSNNNQTNANSNNNSNNNNNSNKKQNANQAYIEQEVLRQNIRASRALIANITDSVSPEELASNPTYIYLNNVLSWEQEQLTELQNTQGVVDKASDGSKINKKELQDGLYYSAANAKVIICNDRAQKIAASEGKNDAVLLDTFNVSETIKNSSAYQQAQAYTKKGIEDVDLTNITDPKVHNSFDDLNNQLTSFIDNEKTAKKGIKLDENYSMIATVVTHNLEANNLDMLETVKKAVHPKKEQKEEETNKEDNKKEEKNDKEEENNKDNEEEDVAEYQRGALFRKLCINPNVDNYRRSRNFMAATVANARLYMDKNGLADSTEYEIFNKMASKWMATVGAENLSTIRGGKDRDKEAEQLNSAWVELEKQYASNPEALTKAQQLWTLCTVQSENTALKYRKEKSSARMVKLTTQQKVDFIMQHGKFNMQQKQIDALMNAKNEKDVDRIINNVRASNRKLDNDYKKEKSKLNGEEVKAEEVKEKAPKKQTAKKEQKAAKRTGGLDDFMDLGDNVAPKTDKKQAKKKTTTQKAQRKEKPKTTLDDFTEEKNAEVKVDNEAWASIGKQQFIMQQNIANIDNILNIMPNKNDPEYKKLESQKEDINKKLTQSILKEGPCVKYMSKAEGQEIAQTIEAVNTSSYNSYVKATNKGEKLEAVAIPENQQMRIIKLLQTKKPEELAPEDKVLYESLKPVVSMAVEAKKQKALKDKQEFEANKDNTEGYTARTVANKKADQTLKDIAENGDAAALSK